MSESRAELATASRETRMTVAINRAEELMEDLGNVNSRLIAMKGRLLGQFDDSPAEATVRAVEATDRPIIDQFDAMLDRIGGEITEAKRHIAALEDL